MDDFYDDAEEVRRQALGYSYLEPQGQRTFPGRNSQQKLLLDSLDFIASRLTDKALVGPRRPESSHGRFRITLAGEQSRYLVHVDPTRLSWAGVAYLNLPEHCQGGTMSYRHRALGNDRASISGTCRRKLRQRPG